MEDSHNWSQNNLFVAYQSPKEVALKKGDKRLNGSRLQRRDIYRSRSYVKKREVNRGIQYKSPRGAESVRPLLRQRRVLSPEVMWKRLSRLVFNCFSILIRVSKICFPFFFPPFFSLFVRLCYSEHLA